GVRAAGGDTVTDVTDGNLVVVTSYGTLTVLTDGSYTYQANADVISADAQDVFVYTLVDGDGDLSTTTLTIDLTDVTLVADDQTETVYEAALDTVQDPADLAAGTVTGSTPLATTETVTGTLAVAGTGVTYTPVSTTTAHGAFQLLANGSWT
ncbi:Ig-like domain-containing protein, partial [Pseudohoeflea suaedae]|uniref:Ig-like domain-containing protein n=1 Tax=Pseudohoeflea suaedae TaxID=877384 RepID=UPI003D16E76E